MYLILFIKSYYFLFPNKTIYYSKRIKNKKARFNFFFLNWSFLYCLTRIFFYINLKLLKNIDYSVNLIKLSGLLLGIIIVQIFNFGFKLVLLLVLEKLIYFLFLLIFLSLLSCWISLIFTRK